jgi:hypothetical protein
MECIGLVYQLPGEPGDTDLIKTARLGSTESVASMVKSLKGASIDATNHVRYHPPLLVLIVLTYKPFHLSSEIGR